MISEETAQRIAAELKRLADAVEKWTILPAAPSPNTDHGFAFDPNRCTFCGANHGGMFCPELAPKAVS